uniref:Uncharacterized protein n=1 Tax=Hyaloperonospora arabidopsidis (strain Emoy2) TaxID=559515 RepID=M4C2N4_HYAAE
MSDVAVPSFFPTPTEIAGGIRWVQRHPIVVTAAAAAATAVSVLTYFKTVTKDEVSPTKVPVVVNPCKKPTEAHDVCSSTESDASTPSRDRSRSRCNLEIDETSLYRELDQVLPEADGGGILSPQWGWYVSTTPPEDHY